jgi:hypothetical protein
MKVQMANRQNPQEVGGGARKIERNEKRRKRRNLREVDEITTTVKVGVIVQKDSTGGIIDLVVEAEVGVVVVVEVEAEVTSVVRNVAATTVGAIIPRAMTAMIDTLEGTVTLTQKVIDQVREVEDVMMTIGIIVPGEASIEGVITRSRDTEGERKMSTPTLGGLGRLPLIVTKTKNRGKLRDMASRGALPETKNRGKLRDMASRGAPPEALVIEM